MARRLRDRLDLPYAATGAQRRAVAEIEGDLQQDTPMLRLLQGDVGSGKTLVALMAMLTAVEAGGTTLHKSCATPGTSNPCAFTSIATLTGANRFRGLAMAPSGCGSVRRRAEATAAEAGADSAAESDPSSAWRAAD